jgi:hypothetical protein
MVCKAPVLSVYYLKYYYSETNVKHFLFNLLRIKGLYMFRVLLAQFQEALHKQHLVYCVRVMLVGLLPGLEWNFTVMLHCTFYNGVIVSCEDYLHSVP